MATLMTVICDIHDAQGERREADAGAVPIKFNSRIEMEADMCTECVEHYTTMLTELMAVARRVGKPVTPRHTPPQATPSGSDGTSGYKRDEPDLPNGKFACRWPGGECQYQTEGLDTAVGRGIHEARAHQFSLKRIQQEQRAKARKTPAKKQPARA